MRLTLRYGARSADYDVRENAGLTARLRIHVEPTGTLVVEAPVGTPETEIRAGVQKRARWIMDHIERFEDFRRHALPRDYCSGETHCLGHQSAPHLSVSVIAPERFIGTEPPVAFDGKAEATA